VYSPHTQYLRTLPLHHSQEEVETHRQYSMFRYNLYLTDEFYQKILSQREYVEILSPPEVCREMKSIIRKILRMYKKKL
jgi:predicted DNA-binding transcriptional regulator YafY